LSMVYGFAKQSGGHIKIYSEEGLGTVVRVYLPRAEIQLNLPALEPEPAQWKARPGETILVVEDDVQVRRYVTGQLDSLGYSVVEAENGRQALVHLAKDSAVDLLFTDVVMPGGIGGRQLAEEAQKLHPGLKILLTSGYTEEAAIHNAKLGIAGPLLSKPYRKQDLARRIRNMLDNAL
jgi:CheY-like chemotaxis protein